MSFQISRDQLCCRNCSRPIVLPRQSPLGKFQGLENQPTDEWPADFLCRFCDKLFSYSDEDVRDDVVFSSPESLIDDLLQIECVCVQGNSETRRVIYTPCPIGADLETEKLRVLKTAVGIREIVNVIPIPY